MTFSFSIVDAIEPYKLNADEFNSVLIRSILLSCIVTFLVITLSYFVALLLFSVPLFSRAGNRLTYLMLPTLLGSISTAFIFRSSLSSTDLMIHLLNNNRFQLYLFWGGLQFWQYGTLFIYLFWLSFQNISKPELRYAKATKLPFIVIFKDIIIQSTKNQIILFSLICFVFTFYENSKSSLVFFFSRGTNTELIAGWFQRMFQQKTAVISADIAAKYYYSSGLILTILGAVTIFVFLLFIYYLIKLISSKTNKVQYLLTPLIPKPKERYVKITLILILCFTIIPIVAPFIKFKLEHNNNEVVNLFRSTIYTLLASAASTLLSILFGVFARIGWKSTLGNFNNKSIAFFVSVFAIFLIPPICIYIVSFYWFGITGYSNFLVLLLLWIFIHSILALPLLGSFILAIHFRVKTNELDYLTSYKLDLMNIIRTSFLKRFKLEYILTFIFSYSFIWNEFGLNSVMSDRIESFASVLKMSFSGRSSNQSLGFIYYSISLVIALICVFLWRLILKKVQKLSPAYE